MGRRKSVSTKKPAPQYRKQASTDRTTGITNTDEYNQWKLSARQEDEYKAAIAAEADALNQRELDAEVENLSRIYPGLKPVANKDGVIEMTVCDLSPEIQLYLEQKIYGNPGPPDSSPINLLNPPPAKLITLQQIKEEMAAKTTVLHNEQDTHRVTLMKDHVETYPDLWLSVYIQDPTCREEKYFIEMLARSRCYKAKSLDAADLVIFTGGSDVTPDLYGETDNHHTVHSIPSRDVEDVKVFLECLEKGIPMYGVCRGLQLLHILNGGQIYQDVNNHGSPHGLWDVLQKKHIHRVSSVHHQMCKYDGKIGELLATGGKSTSRHLNRTKVDYGKYADVEAMFYRDTCCIGVQGHPEYSGYPEYTKWCLDLINEFIIFNPDLEWKDKVARRIKQEVLDTRDFEVRPEVKAFLDKFDTREKIAKIKGE